MNIFSKILREELIVAQGCTEPIALALASAKCIETLGEVPDKIIVNLSGNMIKNVQGVTIPGTDDLRGPEYASILGMIAGDSHKNLEVLTGITKEDIETAKKLYAKNICTLNHRADKAKLYIEVVMEKGDQYALVEVMHTHLNFTKVEKNGCRIIYNPCQEKDFNSSLVDRTGLSVTNIIEYANQVEIDEIKNILKTQIEKNIQIVEEGFKNKYGLNVGKTLLETAEGSLKEKMKAYASSGSDARMSGCDLPVVINSGSGNQGLTISSPIYIYCKEKSIDQDSMYRALAIANLIPIHIKTSIGRLSAFCGAVIAGIGVCAALIYLDKGTLKQIEGGIKNCIANLTGVICDGAKSSCALKIASSIEAAYLSKVLSLKGSVVSDRTGIIYESIEETIKNLSDIASQAMLETDKYIFKIMTSK